MEFSIYSSIRCITFFMRCHWLGFFFLIWQWCKSKNGSHLKIKFEIFILLLCIFSTLIVYNLQTASCRNPLEWKCRSESGNQGWWDTNVPYQLPQGQRRWPHCLQSADSLHIQWVTCTLYISSAPSPHSRKAITFYGTYIMVELIDVILLWNKKLYLWQSQSKILV